MGAKAYSCLIPLSLEDKARISGTLSEGVLRTKRQLLAQCTRTSFWRLSHGCTDRCASTSPVLLWGRLLWRCLLRNGCRLRRRRKSCRRWHRLNHAFLDLIPARKQEINHHRQHNEDRSKDRCCLAQEIGCAPNAENRADIASTKRAGQSSPLARLHQHHYNEEDTDNDFYDHQKCVHRLTLSIREKNPIVCGVRS